MTRLCTEVPPEPGEAEWFERPAGICTSLPPQAQDIRAAEGHRKILARRLECLPTTGSLSAAAWPDASCMAKTAAGLR